MSNEIDDDTDCNIWAADDENKVRLPDDEIPIKNLPDPSEYDGFLEGSEILTDYEAKAEAMAQLHEDWREVALEWSRRMDQLFAQIVVLERTLRDEGTAPPVDEFEEFTSQIISFYVASIFGLGQGVWSIGNFVMERVNEKKFASVGTQAPSVRSASSGPARSAAASSRSATSASSLSRGVKASKMAKLKSFSSGAGKVAFGLATVASLLVVAVDLANRNKSLKEAIPKFHKWLYGPDDDNPKNLIAKPDITTEEITVGGAAGRILEMQEAVVKIHGAIRTLASLEGIATQNPDGTDRDMNLVYCETKQVVGDSIYDASQVMAATRVAMRMLCMDIYTADEFSDDQIEGVTGLSKSDIGTLRGRVGDDDSLCPGIASGTGGS